MLGLLVFGLTALLIAAYRTPSFMITFQKKPRFILGMAPVGSKEMFNVFIDSFQEMNKANDTMHTPKKWSTNKSNNKKDTSDSNNDLKSYQVPMMDNLPNGKDEIFKIFVESDDDCIETDCVLDTPVAWKHGTDKSMKQHDEMKEQKKEAPFWLDDNDNTGDKDHTPLAWKRKKRNSE